MIKAYKMYTGADGHSHFITGMVGEDIFSDVHQIRFKTTPAHAFYDWHPAPTTQYVLTLTGSLRFQMHSGKNFTLKAGEVLIAMDTTGSGHKWELTGNQPWKRVYGLFDLEKEINFIPDTIE